MKDSKRIAKNTIFLYFRMILIMGVTLYSSRVVLDKLGVSDYGLFNAVGGVVGMLSFLNNTLATGTSRFITYSLGKDDQKDLLDTFSVSFFTHLLLCIILFIILETVGLWFLFNKLVIPNERMDAAIWVYQISLLIMTVSILQVPYNSLVIAHEDMNIYAYLGIVEAICKLGIVYLLSVSGFDKMITYSFLLLIVQTFIMFFFYLVCKKNYHNISLKLVFNNRIFKEMMGFSGWSIIANLSETLKLQGSNVLINIFFRPSFVAAQALSNQVTNALMNFIYQFTAAINPQIIKLYASKDYCASKQLTLQSTVFVFDLVLLICLPLIFCIEPILNLWLVEVPEGTIIFLRLSLATQIVGVFNCTFYIPMVASGRLKSNSMAALYVGIGQFVLAYLLYKFGAGLYTLPSILLCTTLLYSCFIKPYILIKEIGYKTSELVKCYFQCFKVAVPSVVLSILINILIEPETILQYISILIITIMIVILCSLLFMEKQVKINIYTFIKSKF